MIEKPTQPNCNSQPCISLLIGLIRPICLKCGKKKDGPFYVQAGIPNVCKDCGDEIKEREVKMSECAGMPDRCSRCTNAQCPESGIFKGRGL